MVPESIGGHPPHDKEAYDAIESVDYSTPDTVHETEFFENLKVTQIGGGEVFSCGSYTEVSA